MDIDDVEPGVANRAQPAGSRDSSPVAEPPVSLSSVMPVSALSPAAQPVESLGTQPSDFRRNAITVVGDDSGICGSAWYERCALNSFFGHLAIKNHFQSYHPPAEVSCRNISIRVACDRLADRLTKQRLLLIHIDQRFSTSCMHMQTALHVIASFILANTRRTY